MAKVKYYTSQDAAQLYGLATQTVRNARMRGKLEPDAETMGGWALYTKKTLSAWRRRANAARRRPVVTSG